MGFGVVRLQTLGQTEGLLQQVFPQKHPQKMQLLPIASISFPVWHNNPGLPISVCVHKWNCSNVTGKPGSIATSDHAHRT